MKNLNDTELVELADWAEAKAAESIHPEAKKAYGAIRQGVDWLLRWRIKERDHQIRDDKPALVERKQ